MKLLSIILLIAFVVLGYNVIKGQNGVMEYRQVSQKLDEETFKSKKLQARNRALQDEITDLKQGNKVVEELARSELGMVKKDEVFYRVIPKETQDQKRR
ncbi:MAG: septum formation initiator family protein [Succinivibrio sp.]|jgi:cell division protein FtsB|nr:septum formation initiator family protein [Succinivibrio sp.]MCI6449763.1 septum formation initiator family protein [Succinivibrio sp.]MDD6068003.1 septum formation initiator family protein [Succinivibrio sp.]MDY3108042.1 septum formation initiator family protein [Succinivibrio sp.]MDY4992452.1 septum formation initiator family protein [Succinivibrio sp.]